MQVFWISTRLVLMEGGAISLSSGPNGNNIPSETHLGLQQEFANFENYVDGLVRDLKQELALHLPELAKQDSNGQEQTPSTSEFASPEGGDATPPPRGTLI